MKEFEILVHNSFLCLVETFGARVVHHVEERCTSRYFFQNHEPNRVPLSYLQNLPIYYPSFREIKTFNSLLLRVLLHNRFCAQYFTPLKKMFGAWYKHVQNFSALSFTTIRIEPSVLITEPFTSILFKWSIISPLNVFF